MGSCFVVAGLPLVPLSRGEGLPEGVHPFLPHLPEDEGGAGPDRLVSVTQGLAEGMDGRPPHTAEGKGR